MRDKCYILHVDYGTEKDKSCMMVYELLNNNKLKLVNVLRNDLIKDVENKLLEVDKQFYIDILKANETLMGGKDNANE